ncbi:c-type cytochrome [Carboxylicivirga taeanensis]|uniref:c-type cytochrome n=1 Tax=Carboxylicivirga taeanensis TaxID=1416875 RepID=UPI003F6DDB78
MQKVIILAFAVFLMACNSSNGKKESGVQVSKSEQLKTDTHPGEIQYKRHCLSCHQKNAGGIPGMYPPLAKNKVVSGDKEPLINIVLHGMSGEIEVNGVTYNGVMASYKNLSDEDIADILNYLRSGFGNSGEAITPAEVKSLR